MGMGVGGWWRRLRAEGGRGWGLKYHFSDKDLKVCGEDGLPSFGNEYVLRYSTWLGGHG